MLNAHQKALLREMNYVMSEFIGGYENTMMDFPEDSEEYKYAEKFLGQGRESLTEVIYQEIMSNVSIRNKHAKFAGKEFLIERINKKLEAWGY